MVGSRGLAGQERGCCCGTEPWWKPRSRKALREGLGVVHDRSVLKSGSDGTTPAGVPMEQRAGHPSGEAKEKSNAVPLCPAKPSPSFINLPASSPPAASLSIQKTKPPSGVDHKPTESLGLLECMYANLQLQTQLAQQQMAILENLQASMTPLAPERGSKNSTLPALSRSLLLNHRPSPLNESRN